MNGFTIKVKEFGDRYWWGVYDDPNPVALADGFAAFPEVAFKAAMSWCSTRPVEHDG